MGSIPSAIFVGTPGLTSHGLCQALNPRLQSRPSIQDSIEQALVGLKVGGNAAYVIEALEGIQQA